MPRTTTPPPSGEEPSKLDKLTGKFTKDVIVGILIVLILGAIVAFTLAGKINADKVTEGFLHAIFLLIGFFTGTRSKRD